MDYDFDRLTRRAALSRGFGSVAGLAFVCSFNHHELKRVKRSTSAYVRSAASMPFEPFKVDVPIWKPLKPKVKGDDLEQYEITAKPGTAEILKGYDTPILGYDGIYPGPLFHATRGKAVQVKFINQAQRDLVTHLHGGVTPHESDGYPSDFFGNGEERVYTYPNVGRASTLWYHDHSHGETARTLYAGLAGMYILSDPDDDALGLPSGDYDVPLMIADRSFNSDGSLRYRRRPRPRLPRRHDPGQRRGRAAHDGRAAAVPASASSTRPTRVRTRSSLGNDRPMVQIATDGGLLPRRSRAPRSRWSRRSASRSSSTSASSGRLEDHPPATRSARRRRPRSCASTSSAAAPRRRGCPRCWARRRSCRRSTRSVSGR